VDIDPPVRIRADRSSLQFPQSEKQNFSFSIPLNRNSSTLQTRSRIAALLTHAREWTRGPTPSVSIVRFDLSKQGIRGWDSVFVTELIGSKKKKDIAGAVRSFALL